MIKNQKIGLALGGGSARGWAHIGVIQALENAGITIDCVAGTSIGALVGAFVAAQRLDVLDDFVRKMDFKQLLKLIDLVFPHAGLLNGKKVTRIVQSMLNYTRIEDLPLPYCAIATALDSGDEVILQQGDIMNAIRASISVPGLFIPFTTDHSYYVDGGLVNPVPVSAVRAMGADVVIAVDLNHDIVLEKEATNHSQNNLQNFIKHSLQESKILETVHHKLARMGLDNQHPNILKRNTHRQPHIRDVMTTSILILEKHLTEARLQQAPPDLLIRPRLGHIGFAEFNRGQEAINEGYRATQKQLQQVRFLKPQKPSDAPD